MEKRGVIEEGITPPERMPTVLEAIKAEEDAKLFRPATPVAEILKDEDAKFLAAVGPHVPLADPPADLENHLTKRAADVAAQRPPHRAI